MDETEGERKRSFDEGKRLPVSKGSDDQTGGVAKVLIAVCKLGVDHACDEVVIFPVVTQLAQPLEVILTGHLCDEGRRVCVCVCEWR